MAPPGIMFLRLVDPTEIIMREYGENIENNESILREYKQVELRQNVD
jgi:hypothetical protein